MCITPGCGRPTKGRSRAAKFCAEHLAAAFNTNKKAGRPSGLSMLERWAAADMLWAMSQRLRWTHGDGSDWAHRAPATSPGRAFEHEWNPLKEF